MFPRQFSSALTATTASTTSVASVALALLGICVSAPPATYASEPSEPLSSEELNFFEKEVRPLFIKRCYECHSETKTNGGLSLDSRAGWQKGGESGATIIPGKPEESLLIAAINYADLQMPPVDAGGKLPQSEIDVLTRWVAIGAPDPREQAAKIGGMSLADAENWWAFQPLQVFKLPTSTDTIDLMIDAQLNAQVGSELNGHAITPNPPADKRTLIRRATYDLTGLPPTPEAVAAFMADDSPHAFAKVVERLLSSPEYGARWGRHWLDVVRYADTAGENTDRPLPHAWRYRNWVIDAFNLDLPFDEFVRLQIAGDILRAQQTGAAFQEGIIATGYLAIARRFGHDIDKDSYLMFEDVIDNLGKNFLGLTTGCARCHDHKYDPISAEDYYALYGIFDSSRFSFPGCEPKGQPRDLAPLLTTTEVETLMAPYRERVAIAEAEKKRRESLLVPTEQLKGLSEQSARLLAASPVAEGATVSFEAASGKSLSPVSVRRGEVLQLTVSPNGNHGADTTKIEWSIQQLDAPLAEDTDTATTWNVADAVENFTASNPTSRSGAAWCFIETTQGPVLLNEKRESVEGKSELKAWSIGELPSVFANTSAVDVQVWTTLSAKSVFVHPAPQRPVAIAWIAPRDGQFSVAGSVTDAHPAALDGVSFTLQHIATAEVGDALIKAGEVNAVPLPDPGSPPSIPVAYAVVEAEAKNTKVHLRGDPEKLGDAVPRRWLTIFGGEPVDSINGSGREQLANWVAAHPLSARVIVNRIWQGHFGSGLVRSPNDFGSRGELPTHPELLERLATQFVTNGRSIKSMHRLIMNTAAYQRDSSMPAELLAKDPENRWLGRFARRRLSAEEIRDSLLVAAGNLDLRIGEAHPFPPESSWTFTQHGPFNAVYETNRRSVYLMVQRQRRHPYLSLFDGADTNSSTATRQTTTVPTQALYFMNDPFFHAQAAQFAARVTKATGADTNARIVTALDQLFQRHPDGNEVERVTQFLENYPGSDEEKWQALARILLAGNEFLHVD